MKATILYGTETGNAEMLAEDLGKHLGIGSASIVNMADADVSIFDTPTLLVMVTSTYGEGELPSTARALHASVLQRKPSLAALRFAVFSLGDKGTYPQTFAHGGKVWAETLRHLGARQIGDIGFHDASGADLAEEVAMPWLDTIVAMVGDSA